MLYDGLSIIKEVSGVGGQIDFVSIGKQLPDAYSIITCRVHEKQKMCQKYIVWEYTNTTIPRYLRDIVITEYGIADCRSKQMRRDKSNINITDSRFQNSLFKKKAKKSGKLAQ